MDGRQIETERLLRYFQLWERLRKVNLKITDQQIMLQGRYKKFSGKRKVRLYLDTSQYVINMSDIKEMKFTKVIGLVYAVTLKDKDDNIIMIEPSI